MTEELPEGWVATELHGIAEVRLGRQRSPDRAVGDHMRPYMRAANVTWDGISTDDVKEMDFTPNEFATYGLRKGDILLSEASGSATEVGKPAIWQDQIPGACFQNTLIRVRAPGELVPYLYWHFRHDALTGRFAEASKGIGIHHLGREMLAKWCVQLPPLAEQRRIVAKIEELTTRSRAVRAALAEVPTQLDQFRQSVLASAFRGDLTADWREKHPDAEPASVLLERIRNERRKQWEAKYPKKQYVEPDSVDETALPDLPDGWCWAALGELVTNHDSKRVPVKDADRRSRQGEYPYYGAFGIIDSVDSYLFEGSYLLVAEDGKNLLARNKPIAFLAHGKFWVNNHAHVVQPRGGIPLEYLEGYLNAFDLAQYVTGIDQVKLNREAMDRIPIALAPVHEQHVLVSLILDRLSVANRARESVEAAVNEFDNLDQSILAKAFRGELVTQDPADEPASALLARIRTGGGVTTLTAPTWSAKRGQVKFYILLLLRTWNKPLGREMLERGLVLMLNADVRKAILGRSKPATKRTKKGSTPPQFVSGMDALLGEMIDDGQLVPGPEAGFFAEGQHDIDFTAAPKADLDAVRETAEAMKVLHKDKQQATDADIVSALNGEIYELVP